MINITVSEVASPVKPFDYTDPVDRFIYGSAVTYIGRGTYNLLDVIIALWGNKDLHLAGCTPGHPAGVPAFDENRYYSGEYDSHNRVAGSY